jgi:hypothetical protein
LIETYNHKLISSIVSYKKQTVVAYSISLIERCIKYNIALAEAKKMHIYDLEAIIIRMQLDDALQYLDSLRKSKQKTPVRNAVPGETL